MTNVSKSRIKQRGGAEPGTVLHFTVDGEGLHGGSGSYDPDLGWVLSFTDSTELTRCLPNRNL